MEAEDLRSALLTLNPSTEDWNGRSAVVLIRLAGLLCKTVSNGAELSLLLRAFDITYLREIDARQAFNRGRTFKIQLFTSPEQLRKLNFQPCDGPIVP